MIKICYIAPYPRLVGQIKPLLDRHPLKTLLHYEADVVAVLDDPDEARGYDLVVARGYTAQRLGESGIPYIDIGISPYDIIRAIDECITGFSPGCIGFLWSENMLNDVEEICKLYSCPIKVYKIKDEDGLEGMLDLAVKDGCDAFVGGGYIFKRSLQHFASRYVVVKCGSETLRRSIDNIIRTVRMIHKEREDAELCRMITQQSKEAILYLDTNLQIGVINDRAVSLAQVPDKARPGVPVESAFAFLAASAETVMKTGNPLKNAIHPRAKEENVTADYTPLVVAGKVLGVVVSFQPVSDIQNTEMKIRRRLSERGLSANYTFKNFIYESKLMEETLAAAKKYAKADSNILILGETGTGKELMAQSIHNDSPRASGPFVAINCASLPENLLESELFGYVEGAFTGASRGGKTGMFELAHGGTLFLDEISELPLNFQSKLLRALQEREVRRVGGSGVIKVNIRVVAATNNDLLRLVNEKKFREDLYYRLNVLQIYIPPLRNRKEDILTLFRHYLKINCGMMQKPLLEITDSLAQLIAEYPFPGNVRELCNLVERVSVICDTQTPSADWLGQILYGPRDKSAGLPATPHRKKKNLMPEDEKKLILESVADNQGHLGQTARQLGIDRCTLWRKMKKYNIIL